MPGRMVLVRHGATEWSENGKHTGRTDIPLLAEGGEQAKAAGILVRQYGPTTFGQVLTSPLIRAEETCTLAGYSGELEPDLMEWDYGDYEGLTSAEIRQQHPGWTLWDEGVPGGETAADVGRRADRVIQRARDDRDGHALRGPWAHPACADGTLARPAARGRPALPAADRRSQRPRLGPRLAGHRGVEPTGMTGAAAQTVAATPPWARVTMSARL